MRILMLFVDMLRPDLLNIHTPTTPRSQLDDVLEKLGGTLYHNAYTPAPTTGRSIACLWSGLYPAKNGCSRVHYFPWPYLKPDLPTLPKWLRDQGYDMNFYLVRTDDREWGSLIAPEDRKHARVANERLADFIQNIEPKKKQFVFISLPDIHEMLDFARPGPTLKVAYAARDVVGEALRNIDNILDFQSFDEIILFSDHGFTTIHSTENFPIKDDYGNYPSHRSAITLFWHRKGDKKIQRDFRLRGIFDIFPTFLSRIKKTLHPFDGKPLDNPKGHEHIVFEETGGPPDYPNHYWGIICAPQKKNKSSDIYCFDCNTDFSTFPMTKRTKDRYRKIAADLSVDFRIAQLEHSEQTTAKMEVYRKDRVLDRERAPDKRKYFCRQLSNNRPFADYNDVLNMKLNQSHPDTVIGGIVGWMRYRAKQIRIFLTNY